MLAVQRARVILQQLSLHQTISLSDLCQITGASKATIRRDLKALAQQRRLVRVHGGAASLDEEEILEQEPDLAAMLRYTEEKKRIARYAASLVAEDDVVYLDAGTTVLHLADYLQESKALFVTSNIELAEKLSAHKCQVYVLGGLLTPGRMDIVGAEPLEVLRRYNFTKVFLGASGVSISQGFTTPDTEAAMLKVLAASQTHTVYILADSSTFGLVTATTILPLDAAQIITDSLPDRKYLDYTKVTVV